jgi:hypothetical protein
MKTYWLIVVVLLIAGCAPVKTGAGTPTGTQNGILTARPTLTLTLVYPTQNKTLTKPPVPLVKTAQPISPEWKALAYAIRMKAQQAMKGNSWENIQFKEEAYQICDALITNSTKQTLSDSKEILKRFRWGIEFMNQGELQEVIRIVDRYN